MVAPDTAGRIRFTVDLGAPDTGQQYAPGVTTTAKTRTVALEPRALVNLPRVRWTLRGLQIWARAIGGSVVARVRVLDLHRLALTRSATLTLTSRTVSRLLRWTRPPSTTKATLTLTGTDRFGHPISSQRTIRPPARPTR